MTKLATMGTSSCATIALQGFNDTEMKRNTAYLNNPESFKEPLESVDSFYDEILYPTQQELGRTDHYPFSALMEVISKHPKLNKKFTILTLNDYQYKKGYWQEHLEHWGFKRIHTTKNSIGGHINHIYVRDLAAVDMEDDDEG